MSNYSNNHPSYTVIVTCINMSDSLCGIYLMFIWAVDVSLQGTFAVNEHLWRSGTICTTAFALVLWLTLFSQTLLFFLALVRLMLVVNPIGTKIKQLQFITSILVFLFSFQFPQL